MAISRIALLLGLSLSASIIFLILLSSSASAAEEELVLLRIEGDLIGKLEYLEEESSSEVVLGAYYSLLSEEVQADLKSLRDQLSALIPDYEVAYTASDSAELSEVMEFIDVIWNEIKILHRQGFSSEVVEILNSAFATSYSVLAQLN